MPQAGNRSGRRPGPRRRGDPLSVLDGRRRVTAGECWRPTLSSRSTAPTSSGENPANTASYTNALIRLKGGEAEIPAFKADLARVSGRSDIDLMGQRPWIGAPVRKSTGYEAACLLAFGLAALLAALFLVGQTVARYASGTAADLRVLQAVGLTRRQAAAARCRSRPASRRRRARPIGVAAALIASLWMPIGLASLAEPDPGFDADWLVLGTGWAVAVLLVAGGTAAPHPVRADRRAGRAAPRGSAVAAAAAAGAGCRSRPWWARASRSRAAGAGPPCRYSPRSWARSPACSACSPLSRSPRACPTRSPTRSGSASPGSWTRSTA